MRSVLVLIAFFLIQAAVLPAQTTIRICALRVDFQEDQSDLTTGNGKFMIDTVTTDPYAIDPAPHNRTYFNDQIIAAANYFRTVSDGRIRIEGDVFPTSLNGAYTLPLKMNQYNPNTTDEEINNGLARLFRDAIQLADADPAIRFRDYDLVVVFHAGVGKDIDVGFDETPQDISSLYLTEGFFKDALGTAFTGFPVDEGDTSVNFGIIMPETENQEGFQIAMTGILVSNIGSYLGLLDLFSPSTQRSGVGRFGLMDVGLLNLNGLVPSPPGAFSREYLGWSTPLVVTEPQNGLEVARFGSEAAASVADIVKIPINESEYYLLENRGTYTTNVDSFFFELFMDSEDEPSYLEVLSTYFPDRIEVSDSSGVLLSVDDYDLGLPGAGILIWHVDERIIAENLATNRINDDPENRGVDIEEADGSQDIGELYNITQAGFQSELGTWLDFWFDSGNDEEFRPLYQNAFSTFTSPNTRSNLNNAVSHVTIENFSSNKNPVMTFDFKRGFNEDGFPLVLNEPAVQTAFSVFGKVTDRPYPFVFSITGQGDIYAMGAGGKGLLDDDTIHLGRIAVGESKPSLALAGRSGDGTNDLLIAAGDSVHIFDLTASMTQQVLLPYITAVGMDDPLTSPVIFDAAHIYAIDTEGVIVVISLDGDMEKTDPAFDSLSDMIVYNGQPLYADGALYSAGFSDVFNDRFTSVHYTEMNNVPGFRIEGPEPAAFDTDAALSGPFALGDIAGNGHINIYFSTSKTVSALNVAGNPVTEFPVSPEMAEGETLTGGPLLGDIDGDGMTDILSFSNLGSVFAFSATGKPLPGFPLNAGVPFAGTPVFLNLDDDANTELVAVLTSGKIAAWQLPGAYDETRAVWAQSDFNAQNNPVLLRETPPADLGEGLLPASRAYNYPNPNEGDYTTIRYFLNDAADVTLRIFDTAGITVDTFNGPGQGGVDNEIDWNVADIASGVYLCHIEAKSSGKTESKIIKIMVVH